jgi:hypothetical protein
MALAHSHRVIRPDFIEPRRGPIVILATTLPPHPENRMVARFRPGAGHCGAVFPSRPLNPLGT